MPFKSKAQQKWAYTPEGTQALGGADKVAEWQAETPKDLPKKKTLASSAKKLGLSK